VSRYKWIRQNSSDIPVFHDAEPENKTTNAPGYLTVLYENPRFRKMGDSSLLVQLGDHIGLDLHRKVRALFLALAEAPFEGVLDIIPAYGSLLIVFDPFRTRPRQIQNRIHGVLSVVDLSHIPEARTVEVPVVYGGEYGPDLAWVAAYHGITAEEVVRLHTSVVYHAYMVGFMPGFPYLGELPEALVTPRKETPRISVPQGSVGLAHSQTGIYPFRSPGGWQIIGRTPLCLFDVSRRPPALFQMGDQVRFVAVAEGEMEGWEP